LSDRVGVGDAGAALGGVARRAALDPIEAQYRKHGIEIAISGLNEPSGELHGRLSGQLTPAP
jgi:sulfate permease, SulP family